MAEKYSVGIVVTAPAGAEGTTTAFNVTAGRKFKLTRVTFSFPAGSAFYLQLKVLRGNEQVVPREGYVVGDQCAVSVETNVEYESESPVVVYYKNTDTTNAHSVFILFEGEVL